MGVTSDNAGENASCKCRLCGAQSQYAFKGPLLNLEIAYYKCQTCDYLQTETPTWLGRAYEHPINSSDTGIMERNLKNTDVTIAVLSVFARGKKQAVDFAGGWGVLVRLLRDRGVDARWMDKYSDNLFARGFEYDTKQSREHIALTAFEVFEHLEKPLEEIRQMVKISSFVLFSTQLRAENSIPPQGWWYLGAEHGQHIGFFSLRTLEWLARELGMHVVSDGLSYHALTERPVNRIFWKPVLWLSKPIAWLVTLRHESLILEDHQRHSQVSHSRKE